MNGRVEQRGQSCVEGQVGPLLDLGPAPQEGSGGLGVGGVAATAPLEVDQVGGVDVRRTLRFGRVVVCGPHRIPP